MQPVVEDRNQLIEVEGKTLQGIHSGQLVVNRHPSILSDSADSFFLE
jgi:hypothetical protein